MENPDFGEHYDPSPDPGDYPSPEFQGYWGHYAIPEDLRGEAAKYASLYRNTRPVYRDEHEDYEHMEIWGGLHEWFNNHLN